jgi:hypothetical protein
MLTRTLQFIGKVFGRRVATEIHRSREAQQRNVEEFLRADFYSGNFNCGGKPDDDSIPSDAFGDW